MTEKELDKLMEAAEKNSIQILKDWGLDYKHFEALCYDCFMFGGYFVENWYKELEDENKELKRKLKAWRDSQDRTNKERPPTGVSKLK